jgi:hypothetical protein
LNTPSCFGAQLGARQAASARWGPTTQKCRDTTR